MTWPGRSFVLLLLSLPIAFSLAGVLLYTLRALLTGYAPLDDEQARRGHSAVLGRSIRQGFAWTVWPLERMFERSGASPNTLTIAGTVLCGLGALVVAAGDLTVGGAIVINSAGFDFFDGRIARRRGISSRRGQFLDSTMDRYADAFCFGAAAFLFRDHAWTLAAALVAFAAAGIVPYARAKAESLGADLRSGLMQRPERVVLYSTAAVVGSTLDPLLPAALQMPHATFAAMIWFLAVATSTTAIARTRDGMRVIRE